MAPNVADLAGTIDARVDEGGATIRKTELHGEGLKLKMQMRSASGKIYRMSDLGPNGDVA